MKTSSEKPDRIDWHTAFLEALKLELGAYRGVLEFHYQHQLTSEPLRIDCIVVKKEENTVIDKNIGAVFRKWNIVEYKSPGDYFSVAGFYKVYAYACLYLSFNKIPVHDLTITFVGSRYPKKLLRHLREERGYTIAKTGPGIYTVNGDMLPVQLINSSELLAEENLWLKRLSGKLNVEAVDEIFTEKRGRTRARKQGRILTR